MEQKNSAQGRDIAAEARAAAMQEGFLASATIHLEKRAGSERFKRKIEASSASALVNALAVLVRECAGMLDMPVTKILALLATVMLTPYIGDERKESGHEEQQ